LEKQPSVVERFMDLDLWPVLIQKLC